ncbi:hypothetical protein FBULB1_9135 [Fusarium bulbicola]|nr:hypothetical protein FBULB1_9135 [Fusarium bulbicola]
MTVKKIADMAERDQVYTTPKEFVLGGMMDAGGVAHDSAILTASSKPLIPTGMAISICFCMGDYTAEIEQIYASLIDQPPHTEEQKVKAKKTIELYLATLKHYDYKRTFELVDENYKQHSQLVADGRDSIIEASKILKSIAAKHWTGLGEPHFNMMFKRILVDGDYVVAQILSERWPGDEGEHVFDLYRWKNGSVVEHWDVIQQVDLANIKHGNSVA